MNKKKIITIAAIVALVAVMAVVFAACNADTYRNRLEAAGYTVYDYDADEIQLDDAEWGLVAMNEKTEDVVTIVKFKNLSAAKDAEADARNSSGVTVYRQSMLVMVGTEQAIADAK